MDTCTHVHTISRTANAYDVKGSAGEAVDRCMHVRISVVVAGPHLPQLMLQALKLLAASHPRIRLCHVCKVPEVKGNGTVSVLASSRQQPARGGVLHL